MSRKSKRFAFGLSLVVLFFFQNCASSRVELAMSSSAEHVTALNTKDPEKLLLEGQDSLARSEVASAAAASASVSAIQNKLTALLTQIEALDLTSDSASLQVWQRHLVAQLNQEINRLQALLATLRSPTPVLPVAARGA